MSSNEDMTVLCGASHYERKYYFNNEQFSILPQRIKDELQIMCVTFAEKSGGIITLAYDADGNLQITTEAEDMDAMYDDIAAGMEVRKMREEKKDLFESLELFYKVFNK